MLLSDGVFRRHIVFGPGETDAFGRVDGRAILRRFQEIAGAHFDSLAMGRSAAAENGCFWAAVRTGLEIGVLPSPGAGLFLDTWPGRQGHGIYMRHYLLRDEAGGELLRGLSSWVLMDAATRSLAARRDWVGSLEAVSLPGEMRGIPRCRMPERLPESGLRTVTAAETDVNGHMNNAEYYRWGADLLPEDYAGRHSLRRMAIDYKKEMLQGQTAELRWLLEDDVLSLRGAVDGKETFTLRCEYDPI